MKSRLAIIGIIIGFKTILGQNPGCPFPTNPPGWWTPNWDWTIPANTPSNPNHWNARVSNGGSNGVLSMGSPFVSGGTNEVNDLVFTQDYKPSQGWLLLYKDFGYIDPSNINNIPAKNDVPVFMLYNKYRSLVRLYIFANNFNGQVNYAYSTAEWESPTVNTYNNSLLAMGNTNLKPNSEYPTNSNTDKLSVHINDYPAQNGWAVVEFPVHFDPNTSELIYGERVKFILKNGTASTIDLSGSFSFSTKSAAAKNPPASSPSSSNPGFLDYINQGQEFLGKVPSRTELSNNFNQLTTSANSLNETFGTKFTANIVKVNNELLQGDLKKYLLAAADVAAGFNGGLGILASVLKTFVGKADPALASDSQKYIEPTVSSGFLKLQGKITTEFTGKNFELQLPGTKHKDANGCQTYFGMPYYDCPLGVISVQETPVLNKKVFIQPLQEAYVTSTMSFQYQNNFVAGCLPDNWHNQTSTPIGSNKFLISRDVIEYFQYASEQINSFQISGKIKLALNDMAGVNIVSAKAALYFEIEKDAGGNPKTDLTDHQPYPVNTLNPSFSAVDPLNDPTIPSCMGQFTNQWNSTNIICSSAGVTNQVATITRPAFNRVRRLLNRGILQLSNPIAGSFAFQTPFIDIDKFDGTAVTIQDGVKPFLKILLNLKPTDPQADQTPITYVLTYEFPQSKINGILGGLSSSGDIVVEYPYTCEQRIEDVQLTTFPSNTIIGPGNYTDQAIVIDDQTNIITGKPNGGLVDIFADNYIKVKNNFKTDLSAGGAVRIHIAPSGMCVPGGNSYQVDHYFATCNPDPLVRLINPNNNNNNNNIVAGIKTNAELDNLFDNKAYLFPNPNNGAFTLMTRNEMEDVTIKISNDIGETLITKQIQKLNTIDLTFDLKPGIYFVNLISGTKNIKPIKFVVY